jgi:3'5'-cyclic nucleotide phosphodiesterase
MAKNQFVKCQERDDKVIYIPPPGATCLDEFTDVIHMSKPEESKVVLDRSWANGHHSIEIDPIILVELRSYVSILAELYNCNPFHNFEHACHVTMSVSKLLNRIVSPELSEKEIELANAKGARGLEMQLYHSTYGIISDPMAQLAIVFSALIHDVDHRGCSNMQLVKEDTTLAARYRNKSVAEQNSIDLAWNLLMTQQFDTLRKAIFGTNKELLRFRQFIVNAVLATDIFDKELNDLRKARWEKAFSIPIDHDNKQSTDIRATIVIEHIIQASDVSHTMQHWHIYQKWNVQLFREMYASFQAGRMDVDPSTFWYKGELSFFDNYIIPLAKKLKECNVFGVSSDEYLNYASKYIIELYKNFLTFNGSILQNKICRIALIHSWQ